MDNEYFFKLTDEGGTPAPSGGTDGVFEAVDLGIKLTVTEVTG